MKYFLVSSPRCGSHYCGEAIALRTQVLALGECLNSMYHDSVFTFENNQVQVHWPELTQPNARNKSTVEQINKRLDNLLSAQNSWQGQAHLGHISCLGDKVIDKIVDNTHAILLYRDSYVQSIISWIIATESNVWVPREKQEYTPVYYNKEKHLPGIKQLIRDYDNLKKLADTYKFSKVFRYEDFTGDHNIDFAEYKLANQTETWNLPVKNTSDFNKLKLLKNLNELLTDIKSTI
jgi:hypothetical protein